jgi:hypothetical protein
MKSRIIGSVNVLDLNIIADTVLKRLVPSGRGELEITDVNNYYIDLGRMGYRVLDGCLPRCRDVWKFVEGLGDGAKIQGEERGTCR